MAYFLKKSNYKKGTYLQIYESFYDPERKGGAHRSFKALGYVHELQANNNIVKIISAQAANITTKHVITILLTFGSNLSNPCSTPGHFFFSS